MEVSAVYNKACFALCMFFHNLLSSVDSVRKYVSSVYIVHCLISAVNSILIVILLSAVDNIFSNTAISCRYHISLTSYKQLIAYCVILLSAVYGIFSNTAISSR